MTVIVKHTLVMALQGLLHIAISDFFMESSFVCVPLECRLLTSLPSLSEKHTIFSSLFLIFKWQMVRKYLLLSCNYFPQFFSIKQQLPSCIIFLSSYFLAPKENNHSEGIHLTYFMVFLSRKLLVNIICTTVTNIDT